MKTSMVQVSTTNERLFSAFDIEFPEKKSRKDLLSWTSLIKKQSSSIIDLQFFKINSLVSNNHLKSAIWHAWKAYKENYSISSSLSVEFMLYISGQRQISKAINFFGLDEFVKQSSLVIFHSNDLSVLDIQKIMENQFQVVRFEDISFSKNAQKLHSLASLFNYELKKDENITNDKILKLEKYILTCVGNLVFEG